VRVEMGITYDRNTSVSMSAHSRHGPSIQLAPIAPKVTQTRTTTIDVEVPDDPNDARSARNLTP
jgi:hypothetical protein